MTIDYNARPAFTLEKVVATFAALLQAALSGGVPFDKIEKYAVATGDTPAAQIKRLQAMRHRQWLSHNERRQQMRKRCEEFFQRWDAILLPVMPCPAIPHDHSQPLASRMVVVGGEQRSYWDLNRVDGASRRLLSAGDRDSRRPRGERTSGRHSDCGSLPGRSHHTRSWQAPACYGRWVSKTVWLLTMRFVCTFDLINAQ